MSEEVNLMAGFDEENGRGFDVAESTADYQSILEIDDYTFMDDVYTGGGGFKSGNYLVPHQREGYWVQRKNISSYKNHFASVLDAMVDPVFDSHITRSVSESPDGEHVEGGRHAGFIENCDNRGTSLHEFMRHAAKLARLHGSTYIVIDNFPVDEQPDNVQEAVDERIYPYLYIRTPQQITEYDLDDFGNLTRVIITAKPEKVIKERGKKPEYHKRYLQFTASEIVELERDEGDSKWIQLGESRPNLLGMVPVVPIYFSRQPVDNLFVMPPLYTLARINKEMYDVSSEMRELQRSQAFAIKYMQADPSASVALGSSTFLFVPTESTITPGQITADMSGHTAMLDYLKDLRDDFFRIAKQKGVVGVETSTSGIAKEWDFRAEESILKGTSMKAQAVEEKILDMFSVYVNEDMYYYAQYPVDFAPASTMGMIDVLDRYSLMDGIPVEGKKMAAKVATKTVFADQPIEEVNEIVMAINAEQDDELRQDEDMNDGEE